jgi:hypothetical protein
VSPGAGATAPAEHPDLPTACRRRSMFRRSEFGDHRSGGVPSPHGHQHCLRQHAAAGPIDTSGASLLIRAAIRSVTRAPSMPKCCAHGFPTTQLRATFCVCGGRRARRFLVAAHHERAKNLPFDGRDVRSVDP